MDCFNASARVIACAIAICAGVTAANADTYTFSKDFNYSATITGPGTGQLTSSGDMSTTFGPFTLGTPSGVEIKWTYQEFFTGTTGPGTGTNGISLGFGGASAIDGNVYGSTGGGGGNGGPANISFSAQTTLGSLDNSFTQGVGNPAWWTSLTGGSPFAVSFGVNTSESYTVLGTATGTLTGTGRVEVIYTYTPTAVPSTV
jgi:hypothetical protein